MFLLFLVLTDQWGTGRFSKNALNKKLLLLEVIESIKASVLSFLGYYCTTTILQTNEEESNGKTPKTNKFRLDIIVYFVW